MLDVLEAGEEHGVERRGGDLGDRVSEPMHVIKCDRREHGDLAVGHVRRVPLSAHPHFEHDNIDWGICEARKRQNRECLEVRHWQLVCCLKICIDHPKIWLDVIPVRHEGFVADRFSVNHDALVHPHEVWACHKASA